MKFLDHEMPELEHDSECASDVAWFLTLTPEERLESCITLVEMLENTERVE